MPWPCPVLRCSLQPLPHLIPLSSPQVVASLLALDSINPNEEIRLYINAGAGSPYAIAGILDTIRAIQAPVSTIGVGMVGGAVAVLLAGGAKGRRFVMANTRVMLQQPNGGAMGSADEVNIQATELNRTMQLMYTCVRGVEGVGAWQHSPPGLFCLRHAGVGGRDAHGHATFLAPPSSMHTGSWRSTLVCPWTRWRRSAIGNISLGQRKARSSA